MAQRLRGASSGKRPPARLWVPAGAVAAIMLLPLVYLVLRSLEGGWTEFFEIVVEGRTMAVLARSVLLATVVTAASIGIAVPLAWLTART
ncbi:MAG: iron ABC transporter permease, partial [Actinomycetota bacterium]|nr:iron ABC transporter permease [Actinomycetota bacterium]